jgi:hypothetical protein
MIVPTIGRQVWYYPSDADNKAFRTDPAQPCAATVIKIPIAGDNRKVDLSIITHDGTHAYRQQVLLLQDGDTVPQGLEHATWMPYQKGQAAKTEAVEALMKGE